MGLIGNILQSLYVGVPCVFMPPISFLQHPVRWLNAISTISLMICVYVKSRPSSAPGWICGVGHSPSMGLSPYGWRVWSGLARSLVPTAFVARRFIRPMDWPKAR
jgi:hypothetical protein